MPNGYTSDIYEGKSVSLRDYLMQVGRGMSMAIMQRDDNPNDPVKLRQVSTYNFERLVEAQQELIRLRAMTPDEAEAESAAEYERTAKAHMIAMIDNVAMRARYEGMLAEVRAWEPDEKVAYVKEHAERYLVESMEFDCGSVYPAKPQRQTGQEWLTAKIERVHWDLEYHTRQWADEQKRVMDFNEHITAFHRSLPAA